MRPTIKPLLVALFVSAIGLTWRGTFVALGCISVAATLTTIRLRDPGFGRWDSEQIRATVREIWATSRDWVSRVR